MHQISPLKINVVCNTSCWKCREDQKLGDWLYHSLTARITMSNSLAHIPLKWRLLETGDILSSEWCDSDLYRILMISIGGTGTRFRMITRHGCGISCSIWQFTLSWQDGVRSSFGNFLSQYVLSISTFFITLTWSLAYITRAEACTHAAISMAGLDNHKYHVFIKSRCSYRTSAWFLVDRCRGSGNSRSTGFEQVSILCLLFHIWLHRRCKECKCASRV